MSTPYQFSRSLEYLSFLQIKEGLQKKYLLNPDINIIPWENIHDSIIKEVNQKEFSRKVRFLKICKFVYEKDIKISYKLRSIFTALHSTHQSFIVKILSNGSKCDIFLGIKSKKQATDAINIFKGALEGNFPGSQFEKNNVISNEETVKINEETFSKNVEISSVIGIPSIKDKEEEQFIQGIENLILGMNGKAFSAIFIADPIATNEVEQTIDIYEKVFSVLSHQKEFVVTDGTNESVSKSVSHSKSESISESFSEADGKTVGTNESTSISSSPWIGKRFLNGIFGTGSKTASDLDNNLVKLLRDTTGDKLDIKQTSEGSKTKGASQSTSHTATKGTSTSKSVSESKSKSNTQGSSYSKQQTFTNKKVTNFLERLDKQIERLEQGKGVGFWNVGAYFISDEEKNSVIAANIYNGIIKGAESNFETSVVKTFNINNRQEKEKVEAYLKRYEIPRLEDGYLSSAVNTDELTVQINFPHKSVIGLEVVETTPFGFNPQLETFTSIRVGKLYNYDKSFVNDIALDYNKFTSHIFVTGSTGSGKSNVTYNLIDKLLQKNIPFLVIEPAKGEYKDEFGGREDVQVYGTNTDYTSLIRINPFEFPNNIHIYEHIDRFIEILNACWPMEAAMPNLLKEAMEKTYQKKGWFLDDSVCIRESVEYPTFHTLLECLEEVIENSQYSEEIKSNYKGALLARVRSMTNGMNRLTFTKESIPDAELFDKNLIVDLSRVASSESKALYMGILFMKLNEYRISSKGGENNSNLKHITILEEAHNLLKRTSSEQNMQSANLAGKSVEMISNAIAEMRTYGEGFIIADQAPGLLDMSVIRNTNTKICLRLPDWEDRKLVGNAMNLTEEQIKELASLETGVAALYQNDWQEAILCKFDKYKSKNESFTYSKEQSDEQKIQECIDKLKFILEEGKKFPPKVYDEINQYLRIGELMEVIEIDLEARGNKNKNILRNQIKKVLNIDNEDAIMLIIKALIVSENNNHNLSNRYNNSSKVHKAIEKIIKNLN